MATRFRVVPKEQRTVDGIVFASGGEAKRYATLKLQQKAGQIFDLQLQPKYPFVVNGVKVGWLTADFRYLDKSGALIVEDWKSSGTAKQRDFVLRKKLLKALYGIDLLVTSK